MNSYICSAITAGIGGIVAICLIFGQKRQALWDRMAGTVVVDDSEGHTLRDGRS